MPADRHQKNKYCGYCANGHLHWLTPKGATTRDNHKDDNQFEDRFVATMFEKDYIIEKRENSLRGKFIALPPTNCPAYEFKFLSGKHSKREEDVQDEVEPFGLREHDSPNPAVYILKFEHSKGETRFKRETEMRCKEKLFRLIQGNFRLPEGERLDNPTYTYAKLRQQFLRSEWSISIQKKMYRDFESAGISPSFIPDQFLDAWAWKFAYNTIVLSRIVIDKMKQKIIPEYTEYHAILKEYENGAPWPEFSQVVRQVSKTPRPPAQESPAPLQPYPYNRQTTELEAELNRIFIALSIVTFVVIGAALAWGLRSPRP